MFCTTNLCSDPTSKPSKTLQSTQHPPSERQGSALSIDGRGAAQFVGEVEQCSKNCRGKMPAGARNGDAGAHFLVQKYVHYQQWRRHRLKRTRPPSPLFSRPNHGSCRRRPFDPSATKPNSEHIHVFPCIWLIV